jgi:ABC-type transport system involved in multi-copper enzyme maturation permease subunit
MIGLQAGMGLVLATLATLQLRPIFRRQGGGAEVRKRGLRSILTSLRLGRHPALGNRPMLWKELHTGGARGFTWFIGFLLTLIGGGCLAYYTARFGGMAFAERWVHGFAPNNRYLSHGDHFCRFIKVVVALLYIVGILKVAGTAAGAITSEHEEDTWVSMTATDLTGREIIFGKLIGALGRGRQLAGVIVALAAAGVVVRALPVLSIPALIVGLGIYGWFAAALGIWISLQLRSSWRAQFLTISSLLLINITGQGVLGVVTPYGGTPLIWPGFTPYEIAKLADPYFVDLLAYGGWPRSWSIGSIEGTEAWRTIFTVVSLVTYAAFASLLTWDCLRRFEIVAGRARRSSSQGQPAAPAHDDKTGGDFQAEQISLAGTTL